MNITIKQVAIKQVLGALAAVAVLASVARAQVIDETVRQITRDEARRTERQSPRAAAPERAQREADEDRAFFGEPIGVRNGTETGGWTSSTWVYLNQIDHAKQTVDPLTRVLVVDNRLWVQHTVDAKRSVYVRMRKLQLEFDAAPGVKTIDERTKEQFDLDLGYFELPVGKAEARIGRAFFALGRGLVLADVLDGAQVQRKLGPVDVTAFGGTSLKRVDNLDSKVTGFDRGHNDRAFYGVEATHITTGGTYLYLYGLANVDHTKSEDPAQDALNLRYQSHYFGAGAERTFGPLSLAAELVDEGGSSRGIDGRATIDAFCALASALWRFKGPATLTATVDYAFGSGDANRKSVTSGLDLGPRAAAGDQNFLYFGQWDGGLALSPRLSNLEVWRAGMRGRPLVKYIKWPSDLLAGFKVSRYTKDAVRGAISDPLANQPRANVGSALDLFATYKIVSDLNLLLEYGTFKPSSAYPADQRDLTTRFAATTTLSF